MKNRAGIDVVLVVLVGFTCFATTGFAQSGGGKVEIKTDYIVVHPGVKLTKPDAQALDNVLKQYDKALYKIEIYKSGQVTSTLGSLLDMCIDQRTVAELAQAKTQGQSDRAIQLIAPSAPQQTGSAVNPIQGGSSVNPIQGGTSVNPMTPSPTPGTAVNPVTGSPTPSGMSPVNPQTAAEELAGSTVNPQTTSPTPGTSVNPQTSGTATNPQCAPSSAQASEFLQRVKPILEKYSR